MQVSSFINFWSSHLVIITEWYFRKLYSCIFYVIFATIENYLPRYTSFCRNFFIFLAKFLFWQKFISLAKMYILAKIYIFGETLYFWRKFWFLAKILIFGNFVMGQNFNLWLQFYFYQDLNFCYKCKFLFLTKKIRQKCIFAKLYAISILGLSNEKFWVLAKITISENRIWWRLTSAVVRQTILNLWSLHQSSNA